MCEVVCEGGGGRTRRRRRSPGYRIKNKNPTQSCGEKTNYVLWQMKSKAGTTDPIPTEHADIEEGEEESLTEDETIRTRDPPGSYEA